MNILYVPGFSKLWHRRLRRTLHLFCFIRPTHHRWYLFRQTNVTSQLNDPFLLQYKRATQPQLNSSIADRARTIMQPLINIKSCTAINTNYDKYDSMLSFAVMKSFDEQLAHLVQEALAEDVGDGDHSTLSCIPKDKKGKAVLKIKQDGILAGMDVAEKIFRLSEPGTTFTAFKKDGEAMHYGEKAFEVDASIHTILQCERLVLNCMQRMSGIATLTRQYAEKLSGYHTKVLDTRKTTPNFRLLEKEAVRIGGGINHRFGLYDMIMLKDNHIDYCGGLEKAINLAYAYVQEKKPGLRIEVETRTLDDVTIVCERARGKVFRIMLDNFTPEQVQQAVEIIAGAFETEASGGINPDNITAYASTGVDYVSVGGLIHQARSLDLSLKAVLI